MKPALLLLAAAGMLACGCAEKARFTPERYQQVMKGMSADEVEATLGRPDSKQVDRWVYINVDPFYKAEIFFDNGAVSSLAWYDGDKHSDLPGQLIGTELPWSQTQPVTDYAGAVITDDDIDDDATTQSDDTDTSDDTTGDDDEATTLPTTQDADEPDPSEL